MLHSIESKYEDSTGGIQSEQHWEGKYPDGTTFRLLASRVKHTPSKRETVSVHADSFTLNGPDRDGTQFLARFDYPNDRLLMDLKSLEQNSGFLNIVSAGSGSDGIALRSGADNKNGVQVNEGGSTEIFHPVTGTKVFTSAGSVATEPKGANYEPRKQPTTSDMDAGTCMTYCSDGSDAGSAGDLMYAVNDAGTIKTSIIAQRSDAT